MASLVVCLWSGWLLHSDLSTADELLYRALGTKMEDLNQPNAGLQAALLAEFDRGLDTFITNAHVNQDFITVYDRLVSDLRSAPSSEVNILIRPSEPAPITDRYFSEPATSGNAAFLFLPAFLMRGNDLLSNAPDLMFSDQALLDGLANDKSLKSDVEHTRSAAGDICALNNTVVFHEPSSFESGTVWVNSTPVQSYIITSTGVLRICEANQTSQEKYYAPRFKATTFFPERNYFLATVSSRRTLAGDLPLDQAFYVRRPYIDLGGNGIVTSLCKEVSLRRVSDSALCMDFPVGETSTTIPASAAANLMKLSERIHGLGGTPQKIHCEVNPPTAPGQKIIWRCTDAHGTAHADIESKATNDYKRDLSELFGKINTSYPAPSGKLRFTVPIAATGEASGDLLFAELDVAPVRTRSTQEAIAFGISLFCFVTSVALLIGDYGLKLRQTHAAFDEVGVVMNHAPVAYCRADSDYLLIDCNPEFQRMLEYNSSLRGKDFREYLTEHSRTTYEEQIQKRIAGESSEYELEMKSASGRAIEVKVFGAPVPEPKSSKGKKPQTFGIFIPKVRNVTPLTLVGSQTTEQRTAIGNGGTVQNL